MYEEIGQVSEATISQLRTILSESTWEEHISDVTDHQAAPCNVQVQAVDEIVVRWPVDTWHQLLLLRLKPGGKLYRHADEGYGFHIPVETNRRAVCSTYENDFAVDQNLQVGKIYRVDRSIEHEAFNNGRTDRTHLIVILKGDSL
ncbi:MAG: aspartyl/asparaginyl beta-hydroxylase domain-containing protein [Ignavibacteria bacterium]|nr:aspartyl/asparaginyl beta-hydroxylase domain-containing protein [Ignavibacteria bacterium]